MKLLNIRIGWFFALMFSILLLLGSAVAASVASPYRDQAAAERLTTASFHVLTPTAIPSGSRLVLADVRTNADGSSDVDLFYLLPSGGRLHLWETSRVPAALGTKNPLSLPGTQRPGQLAVWLEGRGLGGSVPTLTARISGILVSVDAPLSESDLLSVADSVR